MAKKPNSPDATRRNIRASQTRDEALSLRISGLSVRVKVCELAIAELDRLLSNFDGMKKQTRR